MGYRCMMVVVGAGVRGEGGDGGEGGGDALPEGGGMENTGMEDKGMPDEMWGRAAMGRRR